MARQTFEAQQDAGSGGPGRIRVKRGQGYVRVDIPVNLRKKLKDMHATPATPLDAVFDNDVLIDIKIRK